MQTLTDLLTADPQAGDAEIAARYNGQPGLWQPVRSPSVLAWMGGGGRLAKLKSFLAATTAAADSAVLGLRSAVEVVLLAVANPATELLMDPASDHRVLLAGLVQTGTLTADDADALVARGRVLPDATEDDVADERTRLTLASTRAALLARWTALHNAVASGIDAGTLADWPAVLAFVAAGGE